MNSFQKFIQWIVASSADPGKFSLAIKGFFASIATFALFAVGFFHFNLDVESITNIGSLVGNAVQATLTAISYISAAVSTWALVYGGIRKIWTTLNGTNAVIVMQQSNQE